MKSINIKQKDTLGYKGTVKVKIMKGKKICSSKTIKNEGRWPLFYFLSGCLAGDYATIDIYRPKFLQLFYTDELREPDLSTKSLFESYFNRDHLTSILPYPYMSQPEITLTQGSGNKPLGACVIKYKFMIPFTQIGGNVNYLGLYSTAQKTTLEEPSAYTFSKKENGDLEDLIPADVSDNPNYNLYIEWTLEIKN